LECGDIMKKHTTSQIFYKTIKKRMYLVSLVDVI